MRIHGVEWDEYTQTKTTYCSEDGKFHIKQEQDVAPHLDYSTALANAPEYAKQGIKDNFQHVVHIPNVVCLQMKIEDGFDAFTAHPDEIIKFLRKHRDKYSRLFTTAGKV